MNNNHDVQCPHCAHPLAACEEVVFLCSECGRRFILTMPQLRKLENKAADTPLEGSADIIQNASTLQNENTTIIRALRCLICYILAMSILPWACAIAMDMPVARQYSTEANAFITIMLIIIPVALLVIIYKDINNREGPANLLANFKFGVMFALLSVPVISLSDAIYFLPMSDWRRAGSVWFFGLTGISLQVISLVLLWRFASYMYSYALLFVYISLIVFILWLLSLYAYLTILTSACGVAVSVAYAAIVHSNTRELRDVIVETGDLNRAE
jgi:predicted RNA-binding Zn-ribbon protein involved in translation (DUF1610 family)